MQKPQSESGPTASPVVIPDEKFTKRFPTLWAYLDDERWDDGSDRETATLFIFRQEGGWRACLNDRALGRVGFLSGSTFEGLLASVEKHLLADSVDWRVDRKKGRKR